MATVRSKEQLQEEEKRLIAEIEKKHGKSVQQLYDEREKRVRDAIELKIPDRVPVLVGGGAFSARYAGLTSSAQYYDQVAYMEACKKTMLDFEPDQGNVGVNVVPGPVLELLAPKHQAWPGGSLPEDAPYQFIEGEYMLADEYDHFLSDPSDFTVRTYLPRVYGSVAPFSKLPPLRSMIGTGLPGLVGLLTRPEFREFADKLDKAGQEQEKVRKESADFVSGMERLGFPIPQQLGVGRAGMGQVPFDVISDHLRGMRGAMLDMYRCPDKLLAACEMFYRWSLAGAVPANPKSKTLPRAGSALHRGSDGFMSLKQFDTFYWPHFKNGILKNTELGYVSTPFFEGIWDQRLEHLLELPRAKVVFHFEKTDITRAKEILGNHMCIQGGVPNSLLRVGTPQEVEDHVRNLIKTAGKGGGLIVASSGGGFDVAKPENVKAMVDAVNKYGWY